MELTDILRVSAQSRISFVGAGGKTTAVFQAARKTSGKVLVTTTTHLALEQKHLADHHITVHSAADLPQDPSQLSGKVILITGPEVEENRLGALPETALNELNRLAADWGLPLLLESDGARKLPVKAPAAHEPPIPDFVSSVVVMVGLSGLGKPLNAEWVHRPEIFSEITGVAPETILNSGILTRALVSPRGGLKNIPESARKILFINQIDTFPNWRTFHKHLPVLKEEYDCVVLGMLEEELILEVWDSVAGILLAAGGSSRLGRSKQLLLWKGEPFVRVVARKALQAGLSPVVVVTGAESEQVSAELQDLDVTCVQNDEWQSGQGASVSTGVKSLSETPGAAVFLLADQPQIPVELLRELLGSFARSQAPIVAARVEGQRANPVLFKKDLFPELENLTGDQGGRTLMKDRPVRCVDWDDPSILLDVDTEEDYQKMQSLAAERSEF